MTETAAFSLATASSVEMPLSGRRVLIIVENLPVPFDRRVWQEARALRGAGCEVSIISPKGKGYESKYQVHEGIHIYRHALPGEGHGALGYLREYGAAIFGETCLAWKIFFKSGFDAVHACNPPDLIFLVALPFKLLGKKFVFDHHDINPELYEAKFKRRDFLWRLLVWFERLSFLTADVSIATNESYRRIAIDRGNMRPDKVFVVRSGPDLNHVKLVRRNEALKNGRKYLVGYVGVMGEQEGIDLLLASVSYLIHDQGRHDIQFCLVGNGPSFATLTAMCSRMGLDDFVTFLGRVPDNVLFEVMSTADVCVNPDVVNAMNNLSTMNKILEYMAFSKPIVQFEVKEGRYSAGAASLYAKPNEPIDFAKKIAMLLESEDARREMGEFGRRRVEHELCWQKQIPVLIEAYKSAFRYGYQDKRRTA